MGLDFEQYFEPLRLKKMWGGYGKYVLFGIVAVVVLVGIFSGGTSQTVSVQGSTVSSPGNVFYLDVINVDPVIARQFNLPTISGVLVNQVMNGMAGRLVDLKRGDVILKLNNVEVQSVNHLQFLMGQKQPGDTILFAVVRGSKPLDVSIKIPAFVIPVNLYTPSMRNAAVAMVILALTFIALFMNVIHRTVCVMLGAVAMLWAGGLLGFYDQTKAFQSIYMDPIFMLIGMAIFSILLEKAKFLDYSAKKIILAMKGDAHKTILALCLLTYVISLFVNNLSTILVMIPITLYVARGLHMDPVPVAIAEIIASNLGGASTLVGDFPNMLIGASTGLSFMDFLAYMMPICLVLLFALFWYMKHFEFKQTGAIKSVALHDAFLGQIKRETSAIKVDWPLANLTLTVLGGVIAAFIIMPFWKVEAAAIALAGGFVLLAIRRELIPEVLKKISLSDILFFLALFILVGGAQHAGVLKGISDAISSLSLGNGLLYLLILMFGGAICTAFLNAGPAAAFFIPMLMHGPYASFNDTVWWALSLGVLAGSSATLTGATAGIVTQTILGEGEHGVSGEKNRFEMTFQDFSKRGVPIAIIFLAISSVYITFLVMIRGIQ